MSMFQEDDPVRDAQAFPVVWALWFQLAAYYALAPIMPAISMYLSFEGISVATGDDVVGRLSAGFLSVWLSLGIWGAFLAISHGVPLIRPGYGWRATTVIMVIVAAVIVISGLSNFVGVMHRQIEDHAKEISVSKFAAHAGDARAVVLRIEGLAPVLDGIASVIDGQANLELRSGGISGRGAGDGPAFRKLSTLRDRIVSQREILANASGSLDGELAELDTALAAMRAAIELVDKRVGREAFAEAVNAYKTAVADLRSGTGFEALRALAAEMSSGTMLGRARDAREAEGFASVQEILNAQAQILGDTLDPLEEALSEAPPGFLEETAFLLALKIGWQVAPSVMLTCFILDLFPLLLALLLRSIMMVESKAAHARHEADEAERKAVFDDGYAQGVSDAAAVAEAYDGNATADRNGGAYPRSAEQRRRDLRAQRKLLTDTSAKNGAGLEGPSS